MICNLKKLSQKYCQTAAAGGKDMITAAACRIARGRQFDGCSECRAVRINEDFVRYARENEFSFVKGSWDGWD